MSVERSDDPKSETIFFGLVFSECACCFHLFQCVCRSAPSLLSVALALFHMCAARPPAFPAGCLNRCHRRRRGGARLHRPGASRALLRSPPLLAIRDAAAAAATTATRTLLRACVYVQHRAPFFADDCATPDRPCVLPTQREAPRSTPESV